MTRTGRAYTPEKTRKAEHALRTISALHVPAQPLEGRVSVELVFIFEPARSWTKKKRAAALSGSLGHCSRPDLDNLCKMAVDALNGLAWRDDSQIDSLHASKHYGPEAMTRFKVSSNQGET